MPCIDTYKKVDLRTVSFDVPPQEVKEWNHKESVKTSNISFFVCLGWKGYPILCWEETWSLFITYYFTFRGLGNRTGDKRVALFFLNLDILTKWEKEPRVTFIPKQTMKHIWNTKYVSPSLLYQFHFMRVSSSHIIFSF